MTEETPHVQYWDGPAVLLTRQQAIHFNQIRAFLLERGIAVRQGFRFLRAHLSGILATRSDALLPRMVRFIEEPFQKLYVLWLTMRADCRTEILMITAIRNTLVHRVSPMHAMG